LACLPDAYLLAPFGFNSKLTASSISTTTAPGRDASIFLTSVDAGMHA
jgi:hypothetical protein